MKKDIYITDVKVYKKGFTKVYIEVLENEPIFYYQSLEKTILSDHFYTVDILKYDNDGPVNYHLLRHLVKGTIIPYSSESPLDTVSFYVDFKAETSLNYFIHIQDGGRDVSYGYLTKISD